MKTPIKHLLTVPDASIRRRTYLRAPINIRRHPFLNDRAKQVMTYLLKYACNNQDAHHDYILMRYCDCTHKALQETFDLLEKAGYLHTRDLFDDDGVIYGILRVFAKSPRLLKKRTPVPQRNRSLLEVSKQMQPDRHPL
jgi:hypothetical protein